MRLWRLAILALATGLAASACAPKEPPATAPGAPRFPDYIFPVASPPSAASIIAQHAAAWQTLQAGDLGGAERRFEGLLKRSPEFYPAEAGLGYVALAKKDHREALEHFDRALAADKAYVPALAGRGQTLLAMKEPEQALAAFDAALAVDPNLPGIRTTAEVLRFQGLQGSVAAARKAADAGRLGEARTAYQRAIAATPDSPFLYRELATVERRDARLEEALRHAEKAVQLEPGDPRNHVVLADILEAQGQFARAADALGAALAIEPSEPLSRRAEALRERAALAAMPVEYRSIESASTVTRAQLAALIGVELDDLVKRSPGRSGVVMTDIRGSWAQPWILGVTRAGFMEPFPNHTFQPNATVRRGDLASAASNVLNVIAATRPQLAASWRNARPRFSDVPPGHLRYPALAVAVAAGVMSPLGDGSFQVARPVTGAEAVAAVRKLRELAGGRRR